jgi:hypothetical protein
MAGARTTMAGAVAKIRQALQGQPGAVVNLRLCDGAVVDRFGALDGFLLWPEGTPFAERAQPPDVLGQSFPDHGWSPWASRPTCRCSPGSPSRGSASQACGRLQAGHSGTDGVRFPSLRRAREVGHHAAFGPVVTTNRPPRTGWWIAKRSRRPLR